MIPTSLYMLARNLIVRASIRESKSRIQYKSHGHRYFQNLPLPLHLHLHLDTAAYSVVTRTLAPPNPTHKISTPRFSQIAGHFSTSSSPPSSDNNPTTTTNMASQYKVRKIAAPNTLEHRIYIEKDGVPISPFHDIPLYANEQQTVLNMVVEIPRWTNGKLEVSSLVYSLILSILSFYHAVTRIGNTNVTALPDLQGRTPQPYQARR